MLSVRWISVRSVENDTALDAVGVRALLRDQHPDLAHLEISPGPSGWDNQMWRLGDDLAVRLPWQGQSAEKLLLKEHQWVPELAPALSLPVPVPQRLGRPSNAYPYHWIVTTWIAGTPADVETASNGASSADALATFWDSLHQPCPSDAPVGRGRGGSLTEVADGVNSLLARVPQLCSTIDPSVDPPDLKVLSQVWDEAVAAPEWARQAVWLHGDLHPANVLTTDGTISGIVDFGDLCAGDPALDLAASWILLPDTLAVERARSSSREAGDEATWKRGRGWAIWRALGSLTVALAGPPGGKPSWGPAAVESLRRIAQKT